MTEKGLQWDNTVAVYCRGLDYGLRGQKHVGVWGELDLGSKTSGWAFQKQHQIKQSKERSSNEKMSKIKKEKEVFFFPVLNTVSTVTFFPLKPQLIIIVYETYRLLNICFFTSLSEPNTLTIVYESAVV